MRKTNKMSRSNITFTDLDELPVWLRITSPRFCTTEIDSSELELELQEETTSQQYINEFYNEFLTAYENPTKSKEIG